MVNWSHFKPEFAGKPKEDDAEAHLLHTYDCMRTHNFNEEDKAQRICLTLLGEARLWYNTLTTIANDWPALQNAFRQQYCCITFFCQLTVISVIALLNAIVEAMSNIRESL